MIFHVGIKAVIVKDGKVLLLHKRDKDLWEGPGGKIEADESITETMVEAADKIVSFPTDFMPDYAVNSPKAELWDVDGPHYNQEKGMEFVREVRDEIQRRVQVLVKENA